MRLEVDKGISTRKDKEKIFLRIWAYILDRFYLMTRKSTVNKYKKLKNYWESSTKRNSFFLGIRLSLTIRHIVLMETILLNVKKDTIKESNKYNEF